MVKNTAQNRALYHATVAAVVLWGGFASGAGLSAAETHPALGRYPSPDKLQGGIDRTRAADSQTFVAARVDFDLAIRAVFVLAPPKLPGEVRPHVAPKLDLWTLRLRSGLDLLIEKLQRSQEGHEIARFYRAHSDEYCVDETPELRVVLADVLLNGWQNWSEWKDPKLVEARTAFPDLHRAYALQLVRYLHIKELTGVVLRILLDPLEAEYVRRHAEAVVRRVGNNTDVLDFLVTHALSCTDPIVRESLIRAVPTNIAAEEARPFWVKHLESPDGRVRALAVIEVGEAIEGVRSRTKGEDMSWDIYGKLKEIANNDSNERIRYYAAWAVRRHESDAVGTPSLEKRKHPEDKE